MNMCRVAGLAGGICRLTIYFRDNEVCRTMAKVPFAGGDLLGHGRETTSRPFDLACFCGTRLNGMRHDRHQAVQCERCGTTRFILPICPSLKQPEERPSSDLSARRRRWWSIGGAAMIAIVMLGGIATIESLNRRASQHVELPSSHAELQRHSTNAIGALEDGAYLRAEREFEAALKIERRAGDFSIIERLRLIRLHRQSSLLASLLSESPAAILRHSIGMPEADWQEVFRGRYAGRSLLLDDTISRNAAGQYHYGFRISVLDREAKIDLSQLTLLRDLPLLQPQRMLLGMRLAGVRRESSGDWILIPASDSGVLITDPEMLAGLSIPADAEIREVLKRQLAWAEPAQ